MKYQGQTEYDHQGPSPKQGVILCNLGTPDAPQTTELRRYLKEFLSDPRVVEIPRLLWWLNSKSNYFAYSSAPISQTV